MVARGWVQQSCPASSVLPKGESRDVGGEAMRLSFMLSSILAFAAL